MSSQEPDPEPSGGTADAVFERHRRRLFAIAYRMLGTATDAEDVVHDAYLRWRAAGRDDVRSPGSYLSTVVVRLCMDALGSARARRESYVGPWLPEPLLVDSADPALTASLAESLSLAFLVLLEELAPAERAAFLLHDVFDYGYPEVAAMVGKEPAACRQLVSRARRRVVARRRRFDADRAQAEALQQRFLAACARGDLAGLMTMLAPDVVVWTDGGGKATAARYPVVGAHRSARFLVGVARKQPAGAVVRAVDLNGQLGAVLIAGGAVRWAATLDIAGGLVEAFRVVLNPHKLAAVNAALAAAGGSVHG